VEVVLVPVDELPKAVCPHAIGVPVPLWLVKLLLGVGAAVWGVGAADVGDVGAVVVDEALEHPEVVRVYTPDPVPNPLRMT
jgi:hypothetical protein